MKVKICKAREADIAVIHQFIVDLARYEKLEDEVVATKESLKETLFGDRPYAEVVFAESEEKKLGFALFFHNYSTFLARPGLYLEDLYVLPEYRGHGVGKKLLSYLAQVAMERGCGRMEWSVLKWNKPAIDFYHSLGAQPMEEWDVFRLQGKSLSELD